jgi:hypothetical protein
MFQDLHLLRSREMVDTGCVTGMFIARIARASAPRGQSAARLQQLILPDSQLRTRHARVTACAVFIYLESGEIMNRYTNLPEPNSPAVQTKSIEFNTVNTRASRDALGSESHDRNTTEKNIDSEKGSQTSKPLIKQLHDGVDAGDITEPMTAHSLPEWMSACNIKKGDGEKYINFNAGSFLSDSYIGKKNETNRNSIWLDRRKNKDGVYEYWFVG